MNKLVKARKSPVPMSRTMQEALAVRPTEQLQHTQSQPSQSTGEASKWLSFYPRSRSEQYWAVRALSAETLLTAKTEHHTEIRDLTRTQDERRTNDLTALARAHDERIAKMEKLILLLIGALMLFSAALFFVYVTSAPSNPRHDPRSRSFTHFTIPVLSPFASVVEHETSAIGARTIAAVSAVLATLVYFMFRHWIAQNARRPR
ncbi:hypothetical protein V5O48_010620 [Marasmius crinis-equi]|uniref:Uncharacterized protein n=1 Tax=Marasmius crinis-equi TaxID=585013 RepID=A0ABR3F7T7_9AGAR